MNTSTRIRLLVAEDHRIMREGLRAIFAAEPDLEVVGEATDGREAIAQAKDLQPDIVVLDLSMPRMNGLEALKAIKKAAPQTRVLVLTVHTGEDYVFTAMQDGADGYVLKDSSSAELLLAVRSVMTGDRYLCAPVATQVVKGYLEGRGTGEARSSLDTLSTREREVLKLVAEGYRGRQIGEYLCISDKTVEKHRANLMRKLGLNSISALTTYAIEKGLVNH